MRIVKIIERANLCLHIEHIDNELEVLKLMEKIGYDIVALVNREVQYVSKIQDSLDRMLVLSKLCVPGRELRRYERRLSRYDIIAVRPEDRFILNKLIRLPEVDMITVYAHERDSTPSKDQMKIMSQEGKALEILVNSDVLQDSKKLKLFDILLHEALRIEDLVVIVTNVVTRIEDVRQPLDLEAFLTVLLEDKTIARSMRKRWLEYITYVFYKRGVPTY